MNIRELKIASCQVLIVIVSSIVAALNPFNWWGVVFFYGGVLFVPMMSKNYLINFGLMFFHIFMLLSVIHLFDTIKGSVGGPVTDFLAPIIIFVFYTAIYFGSGFLKAARKIMNRT